MCTSPAAGFVSAFHGRSWRSSGNWAQNGSTVKSNRRMHAEREPPTRPSTEAAPRTRCVSIASAAKYGRVEGCAQCHVHRWEGCAVGILPDPHLPRAQSLSILFLPTLGHQPCPIVEKTGKRTNNLQIVAAGGFPHPRGNGKLATVVTISRVEE